MNQNKVVINMDEIKEYLLSEYHKTGIKNLQIDAVIGALQISIQEAVKAKKYEEEIMISKNISIDCLNNGGVILYIDRPELTTMKDFENVFSSLHYSQFNTDNSFSDLDDDLEAIKG
ncbi:MAG: hypothetical protein QM497_03610 [Sulfurimonas sp.]